MLIWVLAVVLGVLVFGWVLLKASSNREAAWKRIADREAIG